MKSSEVRDMTADQLSEKLTELKREQFNLRVQQSTGQLEDTARRNKVRRDIARVKTILKEKRSAAAVAQS